MLRHPKIERFLNPRTDLGLIYRHLTIQSFAVSLIYIFIPVYLLSIGFELVQVFMFLLVEWTVFGLFAPVYAKIIHRAGLKEVILARIPMFILLLVLLVLLRTSPFLQEFYYVIAALSGFSGSLYTLSLTSLFAKSMGNGNHGEKTGKFIALPKITSVLGPLAGGIITTYFGFAALFIFTAFLLVLSFIPISLIRKNIDHPAFKFRIFKKFRTNIREFLLLMSYGIRSMALFIILPIAIYLSSGSILSLGFIVSILYLIGALFTVYLGKLTDRHGARAVIRPGILITALFFLALGCLLEHDIFIYLSIFSGIIGIVMDIPYESHLYELSRKSRSPLEFLAFKEFSLAFGRLLLFGLLVFVQSNLDLAFYLGAASSAVFFLF